MRSTIELGLILGSIITSLGASPQTLKTFETKGIDIKNGKVSDGFSGIVSLQDAKGNSFCGGALLTPNLVLTAAHCLLTHKANAVYAQIDEKSLDKANLNDRITGKSIHFPPKFEALLTYKQDILDINYDIALLRLNKNSTKGTMKLNTDKDPLKVNDLATAIGWGRISGQLMNPKPRNLNQVDLKLTDSKKCSDVFDNFSTNESYCFTSPDNNPGASTCMGDSGSPLLLNEMVIGVVSAGSAKCDNNLAIYTKTSTHNDWVQDFITNGSPKDNPVRAIPLNKNLT